MEKYKSYGFRIYPTEQQKKQIDLTIDCCRFVYNHMLERNIKIYKRRGEHLSTFDMNNLLPQMKSYLPWLSKADNRALKATCAHLNYAYQFFFTGKRNFPRFKSKRRSRQSYETAERVHFRDGKLKIPKVGWIETSENREVSEHICSVTIVRDHDKYYANLRCKYEESVHQVDVVNRIGLDYKTSGLYVDSNGNCCDMPHYYIKAQKRTAKEQRRLSRKKGWKKGETPSNNFFKQTNKLHKRTLHVANQRKDFLHKKSTEIANQYDFVAVETFEMDEIAKRGKMRLGKATKDNGYAMFVRMLEYKLEDRGKRLVKVDKYYPSSQLCSCCGYKNASLKDLSIRQWTCPECGAVHDRDMNAAINILNEAMRIAL